ncbi:unnamed protein product, partial [Staurois parvus]
MKCPWYLFIGFYGCALSVGKDTGAPRSPIARGPHELSVCPWLLHLLSVIHQCCPAVPSVSAHQCRPSV